MAETQPITVETWASRTLRCTETVSMERTSDLADVVLHTVLTAFILRLLRSTIEIVVYSFQRNAILDALTAYAPWQTPPDQLG